MSQQQSYSRYRVPHKNQSDMMEPLDPQFVANQAFNLTWQKKQGNIQVLPASSNANLLTNFKGSIMRFWDEFFSEKATSKFTGDEREMLRKRLLLLEHEVDGMLKRKINFVISDDGNGERNIEYARILTQKEDRILELEAKIRNLEVKIEKYQKRQFQFQAEIKRFKSTVVSLEKPSFDKREILSMFEKDQQLKAVQKKYQALKKQVSSFAALLNIHIQKLKGTSYRFEFENQLKNLLNVDCEVESYVVDGILTFVDYRDRTIEVPIQDGRTREIIQVLAYNMNKMFKTYPKLKQQCSAEVLQLFSGELLAFLEVGSLDRVVEIVKYVPELVRVENVYAYSSEQSRKIQFHLRILIKALLEELQKIKNKHGLTLEIDEGIIGMIRQQIMAVVDVDDILKIFRSVPKIVEVQKIIEKVVDRVIEVPQVVPVEIVREIPVQVVRYEEIEKIIHVPVDVIKPIDRIIEKLIPVQTIIEKHVQVPVLKEVICEKIVEVPKEIRTEVIVQKIVPVEKIVQVEKIVREIIPEPYAVEIVQEKHIIPPPTIQTKPFEVEVLHEKPTIFYETIQVPKVVQNVQTIVKTETQIRPVQEKIHVVEEKVKVQDIIEQVPVPVAVIHEKPVDITTKIVEQIPIQNVKTNIKEVEIQKEIIKKVVEQRVIVKQIEKPVYIVKEEIKEVEKIVEVPVIQEIVKVVPEVVTKVVVEKWIKEVPIQCPRYVEVPIEKPKIIQIEKEVVHYSNKQVPVKILVDRIVPITKTVERIKEVRVNIDKLIQKMVEVPKVVEVEKVVEKVVVVPRVIEKLVPVPQVVEKVVPKETVIEKQVIVEVERIVEIEVEKPVPVQVTKNVYITNEIEKIVNVEKLVYVQEYPDPKIEVVKEQKDRVVVEKKKQILHLDKEKIVPQIQEVPRPIEVIKIVPEKVQDILVVDRNVEVVVPVQNIEYVPKHFVKTIHTEVPILKEIPKVETVQCRVEVPVRDKEIQVVENIRVEVEKKVEVVEVMKQVNHFIERKLEVPREVKEIREKVVECPVYETTLKPIEIEKNVVIEKIEPRIIEQEKIVYTENPLIIPQETRIPFEVPILVRENFPVQVCRQVVVPIEKTNTIVEEFEKIVQKIIPEVCLDLRTDVRNVVEKVVEGVYVKEEKIVPVNTTIEKLVEVPHILEKIVEKIVIMPQIVEVLKYVHEIVEEKNLGVAVDVDIQVQQSRYKQLYGNLKSKFSILLAELGRLKTVNPELQYQIKIIEQFLNQLDKLIAFPRIVQVTKEVEKEVKNNVPVLVPSLDINSQRHISTLSMIIHKLMVEILQIRNRNSNIEFNLDTDILKIFASDFKYKDFFEGKEILGENVSTIYAHYDNMLNTLGGSNLELAEKMIYTASLQQRLIMGDLIREANLEIEKVKKISEGRDQAYKRLKQDYFDLTHKFMDLEKISEKGDFTLIMEFIGGIMRMVRQQGIHVPSTGLLEDVFVHSTHEHFIRVDSAFREIIAENEHLKNALIKAKTQIPSLEGIADRERVINTLERRIVELNGEISRLRSQTQVSVNVQGSTEEYQIRIRTLNSKIEELQSQLRTTKIDSDNKIRAKDARIRDLEETVFKLEEKIKIGDSRVTEVGGGGRYTTSSYSGERMSSSMHSSSSGSDFQTPSRVVQAQTTVTGTRKYGTGTYGTGQGQGLSYETGGGRITGTTESTSQVTYGGQVEGTTNPTYGRTTGTSGTTGTTYTSGNASYTSGTGNYKRTYGTGGLNQSGSSQGSVSYGRQYTATQSSQFAEGTQGGTQGTTQGTTQSTTQGTTQGTTQSGVRYYTSSSSSRQTQNQP